MKDIHDVLREKEREMEQIKRLVYCLKFVIPYLAEDKDLRRTVDPKTVAIGEGLEDWP